MGSGSEEGAYLRLIDGCITQLRLEINKEEREECIRIYIRHSITVLPAVLRERVCVCVCVQRERESVCVCVC